MRKQVLIVLLPLLATVLVAAAAETQSSKTGSSRHATLQKVSVVAGDDGITVELITRGAVVRQVAVLDAPARVVLDLPDTVSATSLNHISVQSAGVKDVRVGMDGHAPPTTRVVVDLERSCNYQLLPSVGNKLALKLHTKPAVAMTATAAAPAPAANASEAATEKQRAISETKPVASASSATDYVFVEPSYRPKDPAAATVKPAVADPSARAGVAARKFA